MRDHIFTDSVINLVPDSLVQECEDLDTLTPDDVVLFFDERAAIEAAESEVNHAIYTQQ